MVALVSTYREALMLSLSSISEVTDASKLGFSPLSQSI